MHTIKRLAVTVAALTSLLVTAPAHAEEPWPTMGYATPTVCVTDTLPGQKWRVGYAIRTWNAVQSYVHLTAHCGPGMGVLSVTVYNLRDGKGGDATISADNQWTLGTDATTWFYGHVDVRFNNDSRRPGNSPQARAANRCFAQQTAVHEFGHALGLGHVDDPASAVYAGPSPTACGTPTAGDLAALAAIYDGR